MVLAVDQIATVVPDDKYHPNQVAVIWLKDGSRVRTNYKHNVGSLYDLIRESEK